MDRTSATLEHHGGADGVTGSCHRLRAAIEAAHTNGGTVIIPAFSISHTQELLYELETIIAREEIEGEQQEEGTNTRIPSPPAGGEGQGEGADTRIPSPTAGGEGQGEGATTDWQNIEILVDSPLAANFTTVYRDLRRYWDEEAHERLAAGRHPLDFDNLYTVGDHEEHLRAVDYLATSGRPAVVIAAAGMCTGGRVVNYLQRMLGDERHCVLFVGYQAAGTPGRSIQQQGQGGSVELDGRTYPIRAPIDTINGYSAHADQRNLIDFVTGIPEWPHEIHLVHGEPDARNALHHALEQNAR